MPFWSFFSDTQPPPPRPPPSPTPSPASRSRCPLLLQDLLPTDAFQQLSPTGSVSFFYLLFTYTFTTEKKEPDRQEPSRLSWWDSYFHWVCLLPVISFKKATLSSPVLFQRRKGQYWCRISALVISDTRTYWDVAPFSSTLQLQQHTLQAFWMGLLNVLLSSLHQS